MSNAPEIKRRIRGDKAERHALVEAENRNTITFELRSMLDDRGWTQTRLADEAGMKPSQINSYLKGYDRYSLATLRRLGEALDVALLVSYVPFDEFVDRMTLKTPRSFAAEEARIALAESRITAAPSTVTGVIRSESATGQRQQLTSLPANVIPMDEFRRRGTLSQIVNQSGTASRTVKEYAR